MEEFDLYGDLELLHAEEKQNAIEDLKWKDKYKVALITIENLQAENKDLKKKIKHLEINFASLFDTARTEIKRKDNLICELRKQKDDICFRRSKPQFAGNQFNENPDVRRAASSESVHVNPFSRQLRKANPSNSETTNQFSDEKLPSTNDENVKRKHENSSSREQAPRDVSYERHEGPGRRRGCSKDENDKSQERHRDRVKTDEKVEFWDKHRYRSKDRRDASWDRHRNRSNDERDEHRDRSRNRSKDRSRHRNRSRDRIDERSRHRFHDRYDTIDRDHLEERKTEKSQERSSRKMDKKNDKKRKRHDRDASQTRSSDSSSWDMNAKTHYHSPRMNNTNEDKNELSSNRYESTKHEENPKDPCKSNIAEHTENQANDSKPELNQLKNVPSPDNIEKARANSKIEILQIEILKDVKEFKKNKLKAEKIPKPEETNPADVAIEKSNQFLEALFDDPIMNKSEEPNGDDLYDDLPVSNQKSNDLIPDEAKEENQLKKDENCNLNVHTPQRQSNTKLLDDLFGPSPAGTVYPVVGSQISVKSVGGSSSDSDFVLIAKPLESQKDEKTQLTTMPKVRLVEEDKTMIDKSCSQIDESINKESSEMKPPTNPVMLLAFKQPESNTDKKMLEKIDENCNFKQQTPQKQNGDAKLMDDLFGPSPGSSIRGQKTSVTSLDESSSDFYFEPTTKPEEKQASSPAKIPTTIDNNSTENVTTYNGQGNEVDEIAKSCSLENTVQEIIPNNAKSFKFVELDSSFYSSEDETNGDSIVQNCNASTVEVDSPQFENITPLKNIESLKMESNKPLSPICGMMNSEEKSNALHKSNEIVFELNCASQSTTESTNKTRSDDFEKEKEKKSQTGHYSSERNEESGEISIKDDTEHSLRSASEKDQHRSRSSRSDKEKRRHHHNHHHHHHNHHHHHHRKNRDRSKESSYKKSSRKHEHYNLSNGNKIETQDCEKSDSISSKKEVISSPMLLYYDDDSLKDPLQNQKLSDQDQVFFLHCDDISSDDEIIGKDSYSNESNDNDKQMNEDKSMTDERELNRNMIEAEKPESTNEFEKSIEKDCNGSLEPESKNTEASSFMIEENPCEAVCSSVDIVGKEDPSICDINLENNKKATCINNSSSKDACDVGGQQFSEDHQTKNVLEKEIDNIEVENLKTKMVDLNMIKEQIKSENHKVDQVTHENLIQNDDDKISSYEGSNDVYNVCSVVEDDLQDENIHNNKENSFKPTSSRVEVDNSLKVPHKEQSNSEENDAIGPLDDNKIENAPSSNSCDDISTPDEELQNCMTEITSIENSSDPEKPVQKFTLPDDTQRETNPHEITSLDSNKSSEASPKKTVTSPEVHNEQKSSQAEENILATSTPKTINDSVLYSNSAELPSTQVSPQKLQNSADELESLNSNSELVSSGRRRKIKTPRKRTDVACVCKNQYATSNGVHTSMLVQSESSPILSDASIMPDSTNKDEEGSKQNEVSATENFNGTLESMSQEEQKPESSSKDIIYDSNNENKSLSSLTEELPRSSPKIDDILIEFNSNSNKDQPNENMLIEEHGLSTSLLPSSKKQNEDNNSEDVCLNSKKTENVHTPISTFLEAEQNPSQSNYSPPESEIKKIKNKEDETNEKIVETHSITIKRNRSNKKNIKDSTESFETYKKVNERTLAAFSGEIKQKTKIKNIVYDNDNCDHLEETIKPIKTKQSQPIQQHQMMKHFMDSEHSFVGTCNYPSATYSDEEVLQTKPKEKTPKKRKLKKNISLDNSDYELKSNSAESFSSCTATKVKRKLKKKTKHIIDSSNSNEEVEVFKSEESKILSNDIDDIQKTLKTATNSERVVDTELKETNVKKRQRNGKTTVENECAAIKRMYNKKTNQILDSSNSNEDIEVTSSSIRQETKIVSKYEDENKEKPNIMEKLTSNETKEPSKKRKYNKINLNISPDSRNELNETPSSSSQLGSSIDFEKVPDIIQILRPTDEIVDEIPLSTIGTTDIRSERISNDFSAEKKFKQTMKCSINSSLSGEEKDLDSCNVRKKKTKKDRKRKLSRSSDTKSDEVIVQSKRSKNSLENTSQSSIQTFGHVLGETIHQESLKHYPQRSPQSRENSLTIALTPTHHKIFLNDVFPNEPPPVYKANEDDIQYHEIDDRLRSMFQSPSYTPSSNVELPIEKRKDENDEDINMTCEENVTIDETLNQSEKILIDETLNQSERTNCDISTGSRKVSLGSNEYVIESIGSHTANVFITRKKSKKRTKVVAATAV